MIFLTSTNLNAQLRVDSNGDTTVKYGTFSLNNDAVLNLGDANNYIKCQFGYGVSIGTGATDIIKMPQYTGCVGILREPEYALDVNGAIRADLTVYSSDERLKRDIQNLSESLNMLNKVKGVSYTFTSKKDSLFATYNKGKVNRHFGFIAQDFQKNYPDLVYEDSLGYLSIDYISVIPLLVEALKEQQLQIEELKSRANSFEANCCNIGLKSALITSGTADDMRENKAQLDQNIPNPFSQETKIGCFIPEMSGTSVLYVYNMNGTQLQQYSINSKGKQTVTISGNSFEPGMYLYALVVDGKEVDTKRMILTK
jgi:hypothetical protein